MYRIIGEKVSSSRFKVACRSKATHPIILIFEVASKSGMQLNFESSGETWNFKPS